MESENFEKVRCLSSCSEVAKPDDTQQRRQCGCLRTSDKLKQILKVFPAPPPPMPKRLRPVYSSFDHAYGLFRPPPVVNESPQSMSLTAAITPAEPFPQTFKDNIVQTYDKPASPTFTRSSVKSRVYNLLTELVQIVQLAVMVTALAIYYFIYCYMQFVYLTLRSLIYFHNADGAMKITIGVVIATSVIVGINILLRLRGLIPW